jgi:hypothetical protein
MHNINSTSNLTYCLVYPYWLIVLSIRIDLLFCLSVLTYCFVYPYWLKVQMCIWFKTFLHINCMKTTSCKLLIENKCIILTAQAIIYLSFIANDVHENWNKNVLKQMDIPYWLIVLSIRVDLLFCLSVLTYWFVYPY